MVLTNDTIIIFDTGRNTPGVSRMGWLCAMLPGVVPPVSVMSGPAGVRSAMARAGPSRSARSGVNHSHFK